MSTDPFSLEFFVRLLLSLAAVCALAIIILKALGNRKSFGENSPAKRRICIKEKHALSKEHTLYVIQLSGAEELLIGASPSGITMLGKLGNTGLEQVGTAEAGIEISPKMLHN